MKHVVKLEVWGHQIVVRVRKVVFVGVANLCSKCFVPICGIEGA